MNPVLHPRGVDLGAWFDGEATDGVGAHVARCARCQRRVSEFGRVRAWVRAQPLYAMGEEERLAPGGGRRWVPLVAAVLLVLTVVRLTSGAQSQDAASSGVALEGSGGATAGPSTETAEVPDVALPPDAGAEPAPGQSGSPSAGRRPVRPARSTATTRPPGPAPVPGLVSAAAPLRLGLIVPTAGPMAAEGDEVRRAVSRQVDVANAGGGVAGRPVELVVAAAEDALAVASLPQRTTALVGGFGAVPAGEPTWIFPADPAVSGTNVLSAESPPRAAGVQLATLLLQEGLNGPIGVVLGSGPDAALASGLALKAATTTVPAQPDGNCSTEIASLRRAGAVALAVAGDGALAARCLQAATRALWLPRFGSVVAPSAAYGSLQLVPEAWGTRTVLALPWPTLLLPGTTRFREAIESTSYRAQVSFAAAELAVDVAREKGSVSLASIGSGTWRTDLLEVPGTAGRPGAPAVAAPLAWLPLPGLRALLPF